MGRRIWVSVPGTDRPTDDGGTFHVPEHIYDCRVLSFKAFLPAEGERKKHLVQLWTDPGGMRTLSVGSIKLKDPNRVAAARARAEREREDKLAAAEQATWD